MFNKLKDRGRKRRAKRAEEDRHKQEVTRREHEKAKQELGIPAGGQLGREDGVSSPLQIRSNPAQQWQIPTDVVPKTDATLYESPTREATVYPYQSTRSSNVSPSPLEKQPTVDADVGMNVSEKSHSSPISIMNRPRPVDYGPITVGNAGAKMATVPSVLDDSDQQEELSNCGLGRSNASSRRPLPSTTATGERKSVYVLGKSSPAQPRLSNPQDFDSNSFRSRRGVDSRVEDYLNSRMGAGHDDVSEEDEKERDLRLESDNEVSPVRSRLSNPRQLDSGSRVVDYVNPKMGAGHDDLSEEDENEEEEKERYERPESDNEASSGTSWDLRQGQRPEFYDEASPRTGLERAENLQQKQKPEYDDDNISSGSENSAADEEETDQQPESDNEASPKTSSEQTENLQQGQQPGDEDDKKSSGLGNSAADEIQNLKELEDKHRDCIENMRLEIARLEGRWQERLETQTQALEKRLLEEGRQHDEKVKEMKAEAFRKREKYNTKLGRKKREYEADLRAKEDMLAVADTNLQAAIAAKESKMHEIEQLKERQAKEIRKATEPLEKIIKLKDKALEEMEADKGKELRDEQEKHDRALGKQEDEAEKELATARAALQKVTAEKEAEIIKLKREWQAYLEDLEEEKEKSRNRLAAAGVALEDLRIAKDEEIDATKKEYNYALYLAQEELRKLQRDTESRETKLREAHSTERETLRQQHLKEQQFAVSEWQEEVQRLKTALGQMALEKDQKIKEINYAHQQQALQWEAEVGRVKTQKDEKIEEINYAHQQQVLQWEAEVGRVRAQKDKKIEEIKLAHQQEVEKLKAEMCEVTLQKNQEIKDINYMHENFVAKLKNDLLEDKANAIRQLAADNEKLLRFSIKKEVFKAMTDTDLEERFGAIRREVDGLARVDWNEFRKSDWPVPERAIQQARIPRVAKQHLIQNTLWAILYDRVFCTPFRVLGSAGRALDQDWAQEFGQGGNSTPKVSKKAEKWRYDNMLKCVEAVKSPTLDNQYIQDGYNSTVRDVTDDLFAELQKVATIDDMRRHDIDKIRVNEMMRMAAQFWLDIGLQRFRAKVMVSETGHPAILSRQSNAGLNGNMNIVVLPELRRLGNAQGDQLEQEEIVMAGDFKVFRVR